MNQDYEVFHTDLEKISQDLDGSGMGELAIEYALENLGSGSDLQKHRTAEFAPTALRMELLRHLLGTPSFRSFSRSLASSDLLADFCRVRMLDGIRWTSKSTLERASKLFTSEQIEQLNAKLCEIVSNKDLSEKVDLEETVDASICLVDSTCLEANIHFPVDWVLLRDVSLSLLGTIKLIRREGLLNRMLKGPEKLGTELNRLCIEMTHARRTKDAKKKRKNVLRRLKRQVKCIAAHARTHRDLLEKDISATCWSSHQVAQMIKRIDEKLEQVPQLIKQAHERIIGERIIASKDKTLSVHESDIHVLVRGKSGKEVEFGNSLFLSESPDGFILDYQLYKDAPPPETQKLRESLERQQSFDVKRKIGGVIADRGFSSAAMSAELEDAGIKDFICPRNIDKLNERLKEADFRNFQKRRGGTEARIAIIKHKIGANRCRAKGFNYRNLAVAWGVLSHNLWWIARKVRDQEDQREKMAA